MLYKETVSNEMWELLQKLMQDEELKDFNLVGGTALSLQIGHRLSVDIDLFSTKGFDELGMVFHLENNHSSVNVRNIFGNTLMMDIDNIKVDIITHQYDWQKPIETIESVRLSSLEDIGAMKLHAIFQTGTRLKDFIDMYFLLEHHPLQTYLENYEYKYDRNRNLACHALLEYRNIDMDEKVKFLKGKETNWNEITNRLKKAVFNPKKKFDNSQNRGRGFRR